MANKIRVTVDDMSGLPQEARHARPDLQSLLSSALQKTVEVEADALKASVERLVSDVVDLIEDLPDGNSGFGIETVSFSIIVDAQGKASLFSAASAGVRAQTGLNFTISRRHEQ